MIRRVRVSMLPPTIASLVVFVLLSSCGDQSARSRGGGLFAGGDGSSSYPFEIDSCASLQSVNDFRGAHYVLTEDVDCSGYDYLGDGSGFRPIGADELGAFAGVIDGDGHVVTGVTINRPSSDAIGLIGRCSGCVVRNLGLEGVDILGADSVGGLVGFANGAVIEESYVIGDVQGQQGVGGLGGTLIGVTVDNSYVRVNLIGSSQVGFIAGIDQESSDGVPSVYSRMYAVVSGGGAQSFFGQQFGLTTTASLFTDCDVADVPCSGGAKVVAAMQHTATYLGAAPAWDFTNVWGLHYPGPSYPCLRWQAGCGVGCTVSGTDEDCDGVDDDCDGRADDEFAPTWVSCGDSLCGAEGYGLCQGGVVVSHCSPVAPEGAACSHMEIPGAVVGVCVEGFCQLPACGDALRAEGPVPERELCDDGNLVDGDACSSTCEPTLLVVDADPTQTYGALALGHHGSVAADGDGRLLFVSLRDYYGSLELWARRATAGGVFYPSAISSWVQLDSGLATAESASPVVVGLPSGGFVVAWTARRAGTQDVVARFVGADGTLGDELVVNVSRTGVQERPSVTATNDSVVIAWNTLSATAADPLGGVRARRFTMNLTPVSGEIMIASSRANLEDEVVVSSAGGMWIAVWVRKLGGQLLPNLAWRRFWGDAPIDTADVSPFDAELAVDQPQISFAAGATGVNSDVFVLSVRGVLDDGFGAAVGITIEPWNPLGVFAFPIAEEAGVRETNVSIAMAGPNSVLATFEQGTPPVLRIADVINAENPDIGAVSDVLELGGVGDASVVAVDGGHWVTWTGSAPGLPDRSFLAHFVAEAGVLP